MLGMVLHNIGKPLVLEDLPDLMPGPGEVRIGVEACGVCRTDLCADLIGWRSLRLTAHIVAQAACKQGRHIFALTRPGDRLSQDFALRLGAVWAGGSDERPPEPLDAATIYAPVGELVPLALQSVRKGGAVVCARIHMSDIPSFPYRSLWQERKIVSVANLTRQDGIEFLAFAAQNGIETWTKTYPLDQANSALADLRAGRLEGAAVLIPPL
jgi:propanol-preferring alcohol dehydrogenase